MPRLIPALVGLVALVTAVPSAAQVGSGKIAYSTYDGIFAVNPDGSGGMRLRSTGGCCVWSPDGTRLAGLEDRYPLGPQLFVINADGSGDLTIAESETPAGLQIGRQAWSPDGSRIAYVADGSIFTVSAAGGDARFVTSDPQLAPAWSPDGTLLAYTGTDIFVYVVRPDGSARRQLSDGFYPVWSPSGESIAFVRDQKLWIMRRDGSERRRLADLDVVGYPAWSPDRRRIIFSAVRERAVTANVFVVNPDGSNLRQLTSFAPDPFQGGALNPTPSPDGDQILFATYARLFRMNSDGSCVDTVVSAQNLGGWAWQPLPSGPPIGERSCNAIGLDYDLTYRDGRFGILVTVRNEGTESLADAGLVASTDNSLDLDEVVPSSGYCEKLRHRVSCSARLDRGQSYTVNMSARPRRYSRIPSNPVTEKVGLHATAPGTLLPTGRENKEVKATVLECSARDPGGGRIDGWFLGDHICGRTGSDLIHPGLGADVVDAGSGVIFTNHDNRARDRIFCGPGRDVVVADRKDRVAKDCEEVLRR